MLTKLKGRWAKGIALTLAMTSVLAFAGCGQKEAPKRPPVMVKTMQVIQRDTPEKFDFTGFVEAQKEANLVAAVSGKITGKYFEGGDAVKSGQVLFTVDQRAYEADVLSAKAGLARAKAEYLRMENQAQRYTELMKQNAVSRQTYDNIIAQKDQAKANMDAQQAMLTNAQIRMGDTQVRAPFAGKVGTTDLAVGNFVTAGQTVMATISNVNPVRIKFSISENEYLKLSKARKDDGAKALDHLELRLSDGSIYEGEGIVDQINREMTAGTGTLTLKARFSNKDGRLIPGMFAHISADAGTIRDAKLIPQRSVKEMLYKNFVFVVDKDNKIEMREVVLGPRVGRLWLVEKGLKGDENLVVEGVQKVRKGMTVKPVAIKEADLSTVSEE